MTYTLSHDELLEAILEKYTSLINSCKLFDDGEKGEAKEMAIKIRALLHDTKKSTSFLTHVKSKSSTHFLDSGEDFDPENLEPTLSLVSVSLDNGLWSYIPKFNSGIDKKMISFDTWWSKIIIAHGAINFSREDIVLHLSNKDGGAHIDWTKTLPDDYAELSRKNSLGWRTTNQEGITKNLSDMHLHTTRQIAHEVILSLGNSFPELNGKFKEYNDHINLLEAAKFQKNAITCFGHKEYENALINCERSLKLNPKNPNLNSLKLAALGHLGRITEVIIKAEEALELYPNDQSILQNLAFAYLNQKDYKKVLELTTKLRIIYPNNILAIMWMGIAVIEEYGDFERGTRLLVEANKMEPNNLDVLNNLCELYYIQKDKEKVREFANKVLSFDAQNQNALNYIKNIGG